MADLPTMFKYRLQARAGCDVSADAAMCGEKAVHQMRLDSKVDPWLFRSHMATRRQCSPRKPAPSSLPQKLYELAILVTARHWTSQYEWQAHHRSALQAGLSPAIADAVAQGQRPAVMQKDEEAVYNFSSELLNTKQVSDATFDAARTAFGERGVVDLIAVIGWYDTVSMLLNTDRYPVAEGTRPELKPLR